MFNKSKKKLSPANTRKMLPLLKSFNKASELLIRILKGKIKRKEQEVKHIRVMISSMSVPKNLGQMIDIQAIDINSTRVRKNRAGTFYSAMNWEKSLKNKSKGFIL